MKSDSAASRVREAVITARQDAVGSGRPEAVLREHVQPALAQALQAMGSRHASYDEMPLAVPTTVDAASLDAPLETSGRADAVYNRFVIEFEPPGSLRASIKHSATQHAVQQVQQYLRGLSDRANLPLERLAGCAFDGDWIVYVGADREGWVVSRPRQADVEALDALVRTLESMAVGRGLMVENLHADFGRASDLAGELCRALLAPFLDDTATARANEMFRQWATDIGNASGPFAVGDLSEWVDLCASLGLPVDERWARHNLFVLHTYFALVTKLVGLVVLEGVYEDDIFGNLAEEPFDAFLQLEEGRATSSLRATNLIEPGIFSWYAQDRHDAATAPLGEALRLAREYSAELGALEPPNARDLLKDLYQGLLPKAIRHRLGEYYTPDWLATHVIKEVVRRPLTPETRVLDPACGSGTFLVMAAREMLANGRGSAREQLAAITRNLVGFDLSPLAVQAAKVAYLLALAPTLRHAGGSIFIPVYLADSVAPPRRGGLLEGDAFVSHTSVGEWQIPAYVVEHPELFPALGSTFASAIADDLDEDELLEVVARDHPDVPVSTRSTIGALYGRLRELHFHRRDGMWWNLLSHAFAPISQRGFDYIIGNPPWVSWETLPESYRMANDALLRQYQLHPDAPPDRPQASRNVPLDLSMLFVASCIDRHLNSDGRLAFVITASVFKSELAGRGFRRRILSDGESTYCFELIEDLTRLRVFEDAQNQTAVLVASRQPSSEGPISTRIWTGRETATIPTSSTFEDATSMVDIQDLASEPVSPRDPASPLLMLPGDCLELSRPMRRASPYLERVRNGIHTRGANGVFFLDVLERRGDVVRVRNDVSAGRLRLPTVTAEIEASAVRPLLRGSDVSRGRAEAVQGLLFFHDQEHMSGPLPDAEARDRFPRAYEFAQEFEDVLRGRTRFRNFDPRFEDWLGLYSVTGAAIAPYKVVYREIASGTIAAAVRDPLAIPDHKLYVIACTSLEESVLLAEVLNSDIVDLVVRAFSLTTSITGSLLRYVGIGDLSADPPEELSPEVLASCLGLEPDALDRLVSLSAQTLARLDG